VSDGSRILLTTICVLAALRHNLHNVVSVLCVAISLLIITLMLECCIRISWMACFQIYLTIGFLHSLMLTLWVMRFLEVDAQLIVVSMVVNVIEDRGIDCCEC
jgi:hypothetical protein